MAFHPKMPRADVEGANRTCLRCLPAFGTWRPIGFVKGSLRILSN
ncbi:hypothetical protein DFI02_102230 [Rhizobium sp. PP-F2F-G20b]|nr:hypothetical protein C8J32_102717 [Rhizobium sp. PP-CC-3A-592]PYE44795.1 hypothetical protein DFI02_102230 [Rhizobium sp. PP-F2F-G20b]